MPQESKDKPTYERLLALGFGAHLKSLGFKPISRRCYRLDGDRIAWEFLAYPYKDGRVFPDMFSEATGLVFPELDDVMDRVFGYNSRVNYSGRRYTYSVMTIADGLRKEQDEARENHKPSLFERIREIFADIRRVEPLHPDHVSWAMGARNEGWHPRDLDKEWVAMFTELWDRYVWPKVKVRQTLPDLSWNIKDYHDPHVFEPWDIIIHALAGDTDRALKHLRHAVALGDLGPDEMGKFLDEYYPKSFRPSIDPDGLYENDPRWAERYAEHERGKVIARDIEMRREHAKQARRIAEEFNLKL